MSDELWALSATELARRIKTRAVSSREVMQSHLNRLDAVNPRINAIVDWRADEALTEADAADAALARGDDLGPLHGVPVTIKVNVDQKGWATSNGVVAKRNDMASEDSAVVANLRRAGAVMLGRSNAPAFSMRWFTDNDLYGRTYNPRNRALTPGGSSGGASAAVAAGLGPIAHGNDQGGSVRYPAYACGVYGLRPSFQRVPAYNVTTPSRPFLFEMTSVQGPLARSVADIRLAWAAMAARDVRDPWWVPAPLAGYSPDTPVKVALCKHIDGFDADPEVVQALQQAARWLQDAGYAVEEVELPNFAECMQLWLTFTVTDVRLGLMETISRDGDQGVRDSLAMMAHHVPDELDLAAYHAMLARRTVLRRAWLQFLESYPLVLMPVSWRKPFAIDADRVSPQEVAAVLEAQSPLIATAVMGLPGLSVPMPSPANVPMGVQLVAGAFREDLCLAAAEVIEHRVGLVQPVDPV